MSVCIFKKHNSVARQFEYWTFTWETVYFWHSFGLWVHLPPFTSFCKLIPQNWNEKDGIVLSA